MISSDRSPGGQGNQVEVRKVPFEVRASCRSPRGTTLTQWAQKGNVFVSLERITGFAADPERSSISDRRMTIAGRVVFPERNPWERANAGAAASAALTYLAYAAYLAWGTPKPFDHARSPLVGVDIRARELTAYTEFEEARS